MQAVEKIDSDKEDEEASLDSDKKDDDASANKIDV